MNLVVHLKKISKSIWMCTCDIFPSTFRLNIAKLKDTGVNLFEGPGRITIGFKLIVTRAYEEQIYYLKKIK